MQATVETHDLWKVYQRPHQRADQLKQAAIALLRGRSGYDDVWALQGVNLTAFPGEAIAIVGENGSGKSTLLSVLAKVIVPTRGEFKVRGRACPLLQLGVGFHPELSGRDNVFLNAAFLGMWGREVAKRFAQIVAFAELEEAIDAPVKTYSSGMYLRLGFAVAAHVDPDVLLIDEALAVGDEHFRHKCLRHMASLRDQGKTLLVVSHELETLRAVCTRALWLCQGRIRAEGTVDEVFGFYTAAAENTG